MGFINGEALCNNTNLVSVSLYVCTSVPCQPAEENKFTPVDFLLHRLLPILQGTFIPILQ